MSDFDTLKRCLGSNLNRAILWLHARNHVESEEEIRNRAYFPRSRLRFTQKAGSKVGAVQDGFGIALRPETRPSKHWGSAESRTRQEGLHGPVVRPWQQLWAKSVHDGHFTHGCEACACGDAWQSCASEQATRQREAAR